MDNMNEVLANTENRGRAWMVFQELKVSYTMAGKSVSDTTLGEVAQRISHDLLCSDGEIPEIFRRARAMKDIPTMAVLSKAFDAYRAESTSNDPLPDILDSRRASSAPAHMTSSSAGVSPTAGSTVSSMRPRRSAGNGPIRNK